MINVTKTFLPPKDEYDSLLNSAWSIHWLTNRGGLVKRLENEISSYLQSPRLIAMANGTLPIQIAIKVLNITGEIITTPFSYVATTSSIIWEGCTPVFVDICPKYLTIDENKIESAITNKTSAILATHVFGNPCHIDKINEIAVKHNLKVIYDAAHCFGVKYKGNSIFQYGDISTCSFHATKLFHTGEGGGFFSTCKDILEIAFDCHNFGHDGPGKFSVPGINGKMSELHAAMGLAVLPYVEDVINARKRVIEQYLSQLNQRRITFLQIRNKTDWNYSYFPIILSDEQSLLNTMMNLESNGINTRRYFYPSLNLLGYLKYKSMPVSEDISSRVLCLPLYEDLMTSDVERIVEIVNQSV